jgi:hypothetical protein
VPSIRGTDAWTHHVDVRGPDRHALGLWGRRAGAGDGTVAARGGRARRQRRGRCLRADGPVARRSRGRRDRHRLAAGRRQLQLRCRSAAGRAGRPPSHRGRSDPRDRPSGRSRRRGAGACRLLRGLQPGGGARLRDRRAPLRRERLASLARWRRGCRFRHLIRGAERALPHGRSVGRRLRLLLGHRLEREPASVQPALPAPERERSAPVGRGGPGRGPATRLAGPPSRRARRLGRTRGVLG